MLKRVIPEPVYCHPDITCIGKISSFYNRHTQKNTKKQSDIYHCDFTFLNISLHCKLKRKKSKYENGIILCQPFFDVNL